MTDTATYADLDTAAHAIAVGVTGSFKAFSFGSLEGAGSDEYRPRTFDIYRNDADALVVAEQYAPSRRITIRREE